MMKLNNKILLTVLLVSVAIGMPSCKKFLSSYSQNKMFIENAQNLHEILIGDGYNDLTGDLQTELFMAMDDDMQFGIPRSSSFGPAHAAGFHYWMSEPRIDQSGAIGNADLYYNNVYAKIARMNTVLEEADNLLLKGEPKEVLDRVIGEAKFLRALYYYNLANLYGKPYRPNTAETDYCIPLKTDAKVKDQFVERATVKQVWGQILNDLLDASDMLKTTPYISSNRASEVGAYAFLSRVYLHMQNYEQSLIYSNKVINTQRFQLTDLNLHTPGTEFLVRTSPEVVFTLFGNYVNGFMSVHEDRPSGFHYVMSDNLVRSFALNDLRRRFLRVNSTGSVRNLKKVGVNANDQDISDRYCFRLTEMYFNKIEALTYLDQFEEARDLLNDLLKLRYKPADVPTINSTGADLVQYIREERRREFMMEGQRWFDIRRYAVNEKYPYSKSITHRSVVASGTTFLVNGYYELEPYEQDEAAYVVPIANDEIEFNQGRITNEVRKSRQLKQ